MRVSFLSVGIMIKGEKCSYGCHKGSGGPCWAGESRKSEPGLMLQNMYQSKPRLLDANPCPCPAHFSGSIYGRDPIQYVSRARDQGPRSDISLVINCPMRSTVRNHAEGIHRAVFSISPLTGQEDL